MNKSEIKLQFKRLKRHYGSSLHNKDEIAFLDLAHTLRIFVDMKFEIDKLISSSMIQINFNNTAKNKKRDDILKGCRYFSIPLSSGVDSSGIEIKGLTSVSKVLSPDEIRKLYEVGPPNKILTRLTFVQWLGSTIINTVNPTDFKQPRFDISREVFIKRVANILGASHPDKEDLGENRFDPFIKEFHTIEVADGYPLTYYQLLEISSEIVRACEPLLGE